jgi:hypothetical protein
MHGAEAYLRTGASGLRAPWHTAQFAGRYFMNNVSFAALPGRRQQLVRALLPLIGTCKRCGRFPLSLQALGTDSSVISVV